MGKDMSDFRVSQIILYIQQIIKKGVTHMWHIYAVFMKV